MSICKKEEIELIKKLSEGSGYFADAFRTVEIDQMVSNINNDFPLLHDTHLAPSRDYFECRRDRDTFRRLAGELIDIIILIGDDAMDKKVAELTDREVVIARKCELGRNLNEDDMEFIMQAFLPEKGKLNAQRVRLNLPDC